MNKSKQETKNWVNRATKCQVADCENKPEVGKTVCLKHLYSPESKLREQIEFSIIELAGCAMGLAIETWDDKRCSIFNTKLIEIRDRLLASEKSNRKAILEEVRSILPKEIENHYGMVSPDVGYNQAIKEMRQKLSILEGETK